ncbi:MAG: hypothetical protein SVT52_07085, partial [Planctomycetota bacterium]|nr:hypothetical protein [Planctomycetota bacterium]
MILFEVLAIALLTLFGFLFRSVAAFAVILSPSPVRLIARGWTETRVPLEEQSPCHSHNSLKIKTLSQTPYLKNVPNLQSFIKSMAALAVMPPSCRNGFQLIFSVEPQRP